MMTVNRLNVVEVEVTRTQVLEVGDNVRINPSYAYAGIDASSVRIVSITTISELQDNKDQPSKELLNDIDAFIEAEVSGLDDSDAVTTTTELNESIWVAYEYPEAHKNQYGPHVLPLETFVAHTSAL